MCVEGDGVCVLVQAAIPDIDWVAEATSSYFSWFWRLKVQGQGASKSNV